MNWDIGGHQTFAAYNDGCFYFRIFGYGMWIASYEKWPPLFSERNGLNFVIPLWKWRVRFLTRRGL